MMNDSTRMIRRSRRARRATARTAAAIIAMASLAAPAAAFGSSQTNVQKALAYSSCMRRHGVQRFPDPDSSGAIPKVSAQQLGVSSGALQAARTACRRLLPPADQPGPPTQAVLRQAWSNSFKFARCMRHLGVSKWPDPTGDPLHPDRPNFALQAAGINLNSPQITNKIRDCAPLLQGWDPYVTSGSGQTFLVGS